MSNQHKGIFQCQLFQQLLLVAILGSFFPHGAYAAQSLRPLKTAVQEKLPPVPHKPIASDNRYMSKVRVQWTPVAGAVRYRVVRCANQSVSSCGTGMLDTVPPFDDTRGTPGRTYYYRVASCNRTRCSVYSDADAGTRRVVPIPPVLAKPDAGIYSRNFVDVQWRHASGATSYKLFRCADTNFASCVQILNSNVLSTRDRSASPGVMYYYRVKACNAQGCSDYSEGDQGGRRMGNVHHLTATNDLADKIQVSWDPVPGAFGYRFTRCKEPVGIARMIRNGHSVIIPCFGAIVQAAGLTNFYRPDGHQPGPDLPVKGRYRYVIQACGVTGCSDNKVTYGALR